MDGEPAGVSDGADAWVGRVVGGRFELVDELGAGGIAVVYRAEDRELSRSVAVKILQDAGHGRAELRARFEREAKVLAALSHPNIVSLVDYGVEDGRAYLVMELLRGQTLGDLLDAEETLPPARAFHIVRQVLRGLAYAHGEGLLHRDLKPDNVFLQELPDTPDHVRLLDFGFAKFVGGEARDQDPLTQVGTVFGTPRYMAPEQLSGGTVDARVDLYAVAVILYEMLSGRRPFEGEIRHVLKAKVVEDPPRLTSVMPDFDVSPALDAFLDRALAMRREARFADAAAFLEALDAIPEPSLSPKPKEEARPPARAGRWVVPALALAALGLFGIIAAAGAIVWALWPDAPETPPPEASIAPPPPPAAPTASSTPDPWQRAGTLAPEVAAVRAMVVARQEVDGTSLRALRRYASDHSSDAYAQLLLGHVYTERNMRAMAIGAYQRAVEADASARDDPRMVVDLVRMVAESGASGATRLLTDVYGRDALGTVGSALGVEGLDAQERRRLEELRAALAQGG